MNMLFHKLNPYLSGASGNKLATSILVRLSGLTSPWREINRKLRFSIREDDLKGEHFLFDGAVWNLHD
jgi:hypothetical protein